MAVAPPSSSSRSLPSLTKWCHFCSLGDVESSPEGDTVHAATRGLAIACIEVAGERGELAVLGLTGRGCPKAQREVAAAAHGRGPKE